MARTAAQLTVAKNEIAAETIAATILDLVSGVAPSTARDASAYRMLRRHATELFELAGVEGRDLDELTNVARRGDDGGDTFYGRVGAEPAYANGQGS